MRPKKQWMKAALVFGGGGVFLCLISWIHLQQSASDIPLAVIFDVFTNQGDSIQHEIVRHMHFPRIVIGILSGAALAVAGVLFQTLTKNPLASPGTLGVNAGAYFFVVRCSLAVWQLFRYPLLLLLSERSVSSDWWLLIWHE